MKFSMRTLLSLLIILESVSIAAPSATSKPLPDVANLALAHLQNHAPCRTYLAGATPSKNSHDELKAFIDAGRLQQNPNANPDRVLKIEGGMIISYPGYRRLSLNDQLIILLHELAIYMGGFPGMEPLSIDKRLDQVKTHESADTIASICGFKIPKFWGQK